MQATLLVDSRRNAQQATLLVDSAQCSAKCRIDLNTSIRE
jgi:hypothetical protein